MRWMEYLSRFDFDIQYVKGVTNKVADSLLRYLIKRLRAEDSYPSYDFVNADVQLDPEGRRPPMELRSRNTRINDERTGDLTRSRRRTRHIGEGTRQCHPSVRSVSRCPDDEDDQQYLSWYLKDLSSRTRRESHRLSRRIRTGYKKDKLFSKIVTESSRFPTFEYREGKSRKGRSPLYPCVITKDHSLTATIIEQGHTILGTLVPKRRLIISAVGIGGLESLRKWINTAIHAVLARLTRRVPRDSWSPAPITYPIDRGDHRNGLYRAIPKSQGYDLPMGSHM